MAKEGNWSPGEKVPRTGTYKCLYCGPDGMGASVLKHAIRSMGIPYTPPASALNKPPQRFLKEGDSFPSCPNCKDDPSGLDTTGWEFVSEKEVKTTTKTGGASTPEMVYFECTRPSGDGTCSDDSCPCGYPGANIPRGSGYFYISKELVEMRRDALSIAAIQKKVQKMQQQMGATMMTATSGVFMPILMCELGAKKRGLDLAVGAADAKHWWETALAPLRPTPMAGKASSSQWKKPAAVTERCPKCGFSYKFNGTSCGHCGYSEPQEKHHVKAPHSTEPAQMVEFHCPGCGKLLNAPENLIGRRAKCPHAGCGKVVTVTNPTAQNQQGQTPYDIARMHEDRTELAALLARSRPPREVNTPTPPSAASDRTQERALWVQACREDTPESYRAYLRKSKQKLFAEEAENFLRHDEKRKGGPPVAESKPNKGLLVRSGQSVKFTCPRCGKPLSAPDRMAGKRGKCPGCGHVFVVPSPVAAEQDPLVLLKKLSFGVRESSVELPEGSVTDDQRDFLPRLRRGRHQAVKFRSDFLADKPFLKDPVDQTVPNCYSLGIVFDWDKMESDYGRQVFEAFFHHVEPADLKSQVVLHFGDLIQFDTFCALMVRGPSARDIATIAAKFGPAVNVSGLLPHEIRFLTADKKDGHLIARSFSLPISATIQSSRIAPDPQAGVEWMLAAAIKGTAWKV